MFPKSLFRYLSRNSTDIQTSTALSLDVDKGTDGKRKLGGMWQQGSTYKNQKLNIRKLRKAGFIILGRKKNRNKDQFRLIKRSLLSPLPGEDSKSANTHVILVTSAIAKEGKTYIAGNLALSVAAELDANVILMEGDIFQRGMSRRFGVKEKYGYLNFLIEDNINIEDILIHTNIPNFAILPSGTASDAASELFSSKKMHLLLDKLGQKKHTIVLIDTPPLLACSETSALAALADQIVFVIGAGVASRHQIEEAISYLPQLENVYAVLNNAKNSDLLANFGSLGGYYD